MSGTRTTGRIEAGTVLPHRALVTIGGVSVPIPDPDRQVHLQFRRFAGCPVCNLHLRSVALRHDEIVSAGVREVVVFHSPAAELREHAAHLPFDVVADPGKRLYTEFGVESGPRALLDPRTWGPIVRGVLRDLWEVVRGRGRPPARRQEGGRLGLPADFLIGADGRVTARKYGDHAYDQWTVDELLNLVRSLQAGDARPA